MTAQRSLVANPSARHIGHKPKLNNNNNNDNNNNNNEKSFIQFKVAQNSFQRLDLDGSWVLTTLYHLMMISLDATIICMVSKNCPIIGEHVVFIFVTQ